MYHISEDDEQFLNLAHNIRTLRLQHGLNRLQMAEILHLTVYTLRRLEKNEISGRLCVDCLFSLRDNFGISFRDMFHTRI